MYEDFPCSANYSSREENVHTGFVNLSKSDLRTINFWSGHRRTAFDIHCSILS